MKRKILSIIMAAAIIVGAGALPAIAEDTSSTPSVTENGSDSSDTNDVEHFNITLNEGKNLITEAEDGFKYNSNTSTMVPTKEVNITINFDDIPKGHSFSDPKKCFTWYKNGTELKMDGKRVLFNIHPTNETPHRWALTIQDVTTLDDGIYKCIGKSDDGRLIVESNEIEVRLSDKAPTDPTDDIKFIESPKRQTIPYLKGKNIEQVEITAKLDRKPNDNEEVVWYQDNKKLEKNENIDFEVTEDGVCKLYIKNANNSFDGLYTCRVNYKETGKELVKSGGAQITLKELEFTKDLGGSYTAKKGERFKLEVCVTGMDISEFQYNWIVTKNNEPPVEAPLSTTTKDEYETEHLEEGIYKYQCYITKKGVKDIDEILKSDIKSKIATVVVGNPDPNPDIEDNGLESVSLKIGEPLNHTFTLRNKDDYDKVDWSIEEGVSRAAYNRKPNGVELTTEGKDGKLTGAPLESGEFTFTVVAKATTGAEEKIFKRAVTLKVEDTTTPVEKPLKITTNENLGECAIGDKFEVTFEIDNKNGFDPASIEWFIDKDTAKLEGLDFDPKTGKLSFTPKTNGIYNFAITVNAYKIDADRTKPKEFDRKNFTLTVKGDSLTILGNEDLGSFNFNEKMKHEFEIKDRTLFKELKWSLKERTAIHILPKGIKLKESGELTGRPTECGEFGFTVVAIAKRKDNDTQVVGEKYFTMKIEDPEGIEFDTYNLPDAKVGQKYNFTVNVLGKDVDEWESCTGLPNGITCDKSDLGKLVFKGTPTKADDYQIKIKAKRNGKSTTLVLNLTVLPKDSSGSGDGDNSGSSGNGSGSSGSGSSGGGSNSYKPGSDDSDYESSQYEQDFWKAVKSEIEKSRSGEVLRINAKSYKSMPRYVMDALRKHSGVTLIISWNDGDPITIPAGEAISESNRLAYALSYLARVYENASHLSDIPDDPTDKPTEEGVAKPTQEGSSTGNNQANKGSVFSSNTNPKTGLRDAKMSDKSFGNILALINALIIASAAGVLIWKKKQAESK